MSEQLRWLFRIFPIFLSTCLFSPAHADAGVSDTRILLGQSAGMSGPLAQYARQALIGAKVYFDKTNQQGGVHGRRIEVLTRDDQYTASLAAYNTRQLIERDRVFALFGFVGWPTSQAGVQIASRARVPFFGPFTGGALQTSFDRHLFSIRASYADEYAYFLRNMNWLGTRKLALLYQQDQYGVMIKQDVENRARREAIELTSIGINHGGVNLEPLIDKTLSVQADVVMLVQADSQINARIVRSLRNRGFLGQFFAVSFVGNKQLASELGELAHGILVTQVVPLPWRISMPLVAEYRKRMTESGYEEFTVTSLEGYIAARVLVEGLKRAGRNLTRERLIRALESINARNYDGGGYVVNFSATNHQGSMYVDIATMTKDARFMN
jgi:ABC-type branched-subunit amino acid transport system substrate-binding protein